MRKYLTKSKFKLAMVCPTKLFYTGKSEYANQKIEDTFLQNLANGGFQVGALARSYFPGGELIGTPNDEIAIELTNGFLARDQVILYEAGFKHDLLLIRADIVVKSGNDLDLYEVKAKSCDFVEESGMLTKKGDAIHGDWKNYVEDVAFQKHVIQKAFPQLNVRAHLVLADRTSLCPTDGLNQKFPVVRDGDKHRRVEVSDALSDSDLNPHILRAINVDNACQMVYAEPVCDHPFEEGVIFLADKYYRNEKIITSPSGVCKDCEFSFADGDMDGEQKSGFRECWSASLGWKSEDFEIPGSLDVWNIDKNKVVSESKFSMAQLTEEFINLKADKSPGLSRSQRQWLQISKTQSKDKRPWIDRENLKREMDSWSFPLHFIDFESSKPVIPFLKGRRPYDDTIFQFSHHMVSENGVVEHRGEYLNATPGSFPNYDFVRALKTQLENDDGTVFRYHNHENTSLCAIYSQMSMDNEEIDGRDELCRFVQSITQPTGKLSGEWVASSRNMVDLHKMVERYYYAPDAHGSISLKYVLPAVLNSSDFLKDRYSQPIYGAEGGIVSRNFQNQRWVEYDNDRVRDPYTLLPMLFQDESAADYEVIMEMDKINDGGAAMTAYCKLQFEDIPKGPRGEIQAALLKYCELDTLAMVMIYEAWKSTV